MAKVLRRRLEPPEAEMRRFKYMTRCLDLRKMAFEPSYSMPEAKAKLPLEMLYKWLATRFKDSNGHPVSPELDDMPPFEAVWEQFLCLQKRLQTASNEAPFSKWKGASGIVLMKDVFTKARFYSDCPDYLYLFKHCATKTICEAVVEGMGGCWDKCSPDDRHSNFESGIEEAVIAWSAPQPFHSEADPFIRKSLQTLFGEDYSSHFHHTDSRTNRIQSWAGGAGKTVAKLMQSKPRLPSACYGSGL